MDGKEAIIQSIIGNAETSAAEIVAAAERQKAQALSAERETFAALTARDQSDLAAETALILSRRAAGARLSGAKVILKAKQDFVDSVYAAALQKLTGMDDAGYRAFIGAYITAYADDGDAVILSSRDKNRIPASFVKELAAKRKISLTLLVETHNEAGGVILRNPRCDKNLTLSALLASAREKTEPAVAEILFNE